jgi:hypothetical protein
VEVTVKVEGVAMKDPANKGEERVN